MRSGQLIRSVGGQFARSAGPALTLILVLICHSALARSSIGIGSAEVAPGPADGLLGAVLTEIAAIQRTFFTDLRHALVGLKQNQSALSYLIGLSFLYGVFHAAGPGHGKAVVSTYVLADRVRLRRGIILAFASSLVQALCALLLVGAGWFLLRGTGLSMTLVGDWLELLSYGLIAAFGAWLLLRKLQFMLPLAAAGWRGLGVRTRAGAVAGRRDVGMLAFAAPGSHASDPTAARFASSGVFRATPGLEPAICVEQEGACGCGRSHSPDLSSLDRPLDFKGATTAALAIGLRPCSGAIVVLTFALVNGLYVGGILSVLAMSLGTAITVSVIATLAVSARHLALRLTTPGPYRATFGHVVEIMGAVALLLIGLALLGGALASG